jgi:hypothetical protein
MRKKLLPLVLAGLFCAASLPGCLYANVRMPLDDDVQQTQLGTKVGRSTAQSVLWLVAWGDAGTEAAAKQGGLTTINHLDAEYFNVLFGAYARRTTIAYGE